MANGVTQTQIIQQLRTTMSYRSTKNIRTPYCRVCKDAGKSESECRSHFTRDKESGWTICPTLLSQKCLHCKKPGHTKKYCGVYVAEQKAQHKAAKYSLAWETDADGFTTQKSRRSKKNATPAIATIMFTRTFDVLSDEQFAVDEAQTAKKKRFAESKAKAIKHYNSVVLPKKRAERVKQWRVVAQFLHKEMVRQAARSKQANAWGPAKKRASEPEPFIPHKADENIDWWDSDDE